eukprot:scaffold117806_cov63-Phaeocystis_antarctica.AAC.1
MVRAHHQQQLARRQRRELHTQIYEADETFAQRLERATPAAEQPRLAARKHGSRHVALTQGHVVVGVIATAAKVIVSAAESLQPYVTVRSRSTRHWPGWAASTGSNWSRALSAERGDRKERCSCMPIRYSRTKAQSPAPMGWSSRRLLHSIRPARRNDSASAPGLGSTVAPLESAAASKSLVEEERASRQNVPWASAVSPG